MWIKGDQEKRKEMESNERRNKRQNGKIRFRKEEGNERRMRKKILFFSFTCSYY